MLHWVAGIVGDLTKRKECSLRVRRLAVRDILYVYGMTTCNRYRMRFILQQEKL